MNMRLGIVGPGTSQCQWSQRQNSPANWFKAGSWSGEKHCMTSFTWAASTTWVRRSRSAAYALTNPMLTAGCWPEGPAASPVSCVFTELNECDGPSLSFTANGAGCETAKLGFFFPVG